MKKSTFIVQTWERRNSYCGKAWNSTHMSLSYLSIMSYYENSSLLRRKVAILPYTDIHQAPISSARHCRTYTNEWDLILAFAEFHLLRTMGPGCTHQAMSRPRKVLRGSGDKKVTFTWGSRETFHLVGVSAAIDTQRVEEWEGSSPS